MVQIFINWHKLQQKCVAGYLKINGSDFNPSIYHEHHKAVYITSWNWYTENNQCISQSYLFQEKLKSFTRACRILGLCVDVFFFG